MQKVSLPTSLALSSATFLTASMVKPGGVFSALCGPPTNTPTRHWSNNISSAPMEETASNINKTPWSAAALANSLSGL